MSKNRSLIMMILSLGITVSCFLIFLNVDEISSDLFAVLVFSSLGGIILSALGFDSFLTQRRYERSEIT